MGYSTSAANFDEARLAAIKALIAGKIADLDASCSRDSLVPPGTLTSSLVITGDPAQMADVATTPVLICVLGGGERDNMDAEADFEFIDLAASRGYRYEWKTNIFVYIHKDLFPTDSSWASIVTQASNREVLRARINDWLLEDVLNTKDGSKIQLVSSVYVSPNDYLIFCKAKTVYKGFFDKGFGGTESLWGLHLVHVGRTI